MKSILQPGKYDSVWSNHQNSNTNTNDNTNNHTNTNTNMNKNYFQQKYCAAQQLQQCLAELAKSGRWTTLTHIRKILIHLNLKSQLFSHIPLPEKSL